MSENNAYTLHHPLPADLERVFDFLVACDIADLGEPDTDLGELKDLWQEVDLTQDAWIGFTGAGEIAGYALISGEAGRYHLDLIAHQTLTPPGLADELLRRCEARACELASGDAGQSLRLTGYTGAGNTLVASAFEAAAFSDYTHHFQMQIDFQGELPPVEWPADLQVAPYQPTDELELYNLIQTAFERPGREPSTLEEWRRHLFRNGRYEPELFVLVRKQGRLVAAALSYDEGERGWIRQIATAVDQQRQGLGSLLLRHMMFLFQRRGLSGMGLGVAAVNQKALGFYRRNGLHIAREYIEYRKEINP